MSQPYPQLSCQVTNWRTICHDQSLNNSGNIHQNSCYGTNHKIKYNRKNRETRKELKSGEKDIRKYITFCRYYSPKTEFWSCSDRQRILLCLLLWDQRWSILPDFRTISSCCCACWTVFHIALGHSQQSCEVLLREMAQMHNLTAHKGNKAHN